MTHTPSQFDAVFRSERKKRYEEIDDFESRIGFWIEPTKLLEAARVLACPPENDDTPLWQHGRVIYSAYRKYLSERDRGTIMALDVGTANGFSSLCALWAMREAGVTCEIISLDTVDPQARISRVTVAECDGLKTLREILNPWPEAQAIRFLQAPAIEWLNSRSERVHLAYIGGKEEPQAASQDLWRLTKRQDRGDIDIAEVQNPRAFQEILSVHRPYDFNLIAAAPHRRYAVGSRK